MSRNTNIEILRYVLMSMIVLWHFIVHGAGHVADSVNQLLELSPNTLLTLLLLCYHVNCFIFISGYFGIKLSKKRLLSFFSLTVFYSLVTFFLLLFIEGGWGFYHNIHWNSWVHFFPISNSSWWFITDYFFLMLIAPILNNGIESLTERHFRWILIILFCGSVSGVPYFCGQNTPLFTFVYMYLLGRYFKLHPIVYLKKHAVKIWLVSVALLVLWQWLHIRGVRILEESTNLVVNYNHPFAIIAAIAFFFIFEKIDMGLHPSVNRLFSGVLSTYLVTDGLLRNPIDTGIIDIFGVNIPVLFIISLLMVLAISSLDLVRSILMEPINSWLLGTINKLSNR